MGGVIGDKVIIPGSPATTLPELLKEVEESVLLEEQSLHSSPAKLMASVSKEFQTPAPSTRSRRPSSWSTVQQTVRKMTGPRDWTKADWELLDSCYTDERLAQTRSPGVLASAEGVDLEKVVDRFVAALGSEEVIRTLGASWTR